MHILLFALFFVLFASRTLGFDLSLAPGLSVKNAFLYLIFISLAIQTALTRQRKLEILPVIVPFVIYASYAIFTWIVILLVIQYPGYSLRKTLISLKSGPVEMLLVFVIFFYGTSNSRSAMLLIRNIVWLVIVGNVITVIDALNIPDLGLIPMREDGRVGGTIGPANEYAAFLALFLPAIFGLYLTSSGSRKLLAGAGMAFSGLAFLMAVSRGAMVGLAVSGVLGAYYLRAHISSKVIYRVGLGVVLMCTVVVAGAIAAGYGELLAARFAQFGGSGFEASSGRTEIWGRALDSMLDHPVTFLTGFGWYAYESSRYFSYATHNTYLNNLYNLGAIGVALFLLVAFNALRVARAALYRAGPEARSLLVAFVFGFLALLVSIFFGELHTSWLYVWAFVGISLRLAVSETGTDPAISSYRKSNAAAIDNHSSGLRSRVDTAAR